jgi:hypothetical protein
MSIPYPPKNETDWYDSFKATVQAIDAHMFAHREDRNLIMYSGATWTWTAGTSLLSWDDAFYLTGAQSGGRWRVPADSIEINDGEMFVVGIPRWPQGTVTLTTMESRAACEQTDEGCVVCVRVGSRLYFRTGVQMNDGDSFNIFIAGGGGGAGDVEKHQRHMHVNGIVRSATATGALAVSVTDGLGLVDDTLRVAAVPGGDSYYVNGKERTEPAAVFSFVNPGLGALDVRLYRAYMTDAGDPQFQQRVTYSQPAAIDRFWVVQCSRSILPGGKSIVFTSIVAGNFWQVKFDGGPALLVPTAGLPAGVYRLYAADGVNWIDVYFPTPGLLPGQFDWTRVNIGGPHIVALTFLPEIDEIAYFPIGTAVTWMDGGFVQWGYGPLSSVLSERRWGNVGERIVSDDFLHYIAERVGAVSTSGVIFDHDAAWSERLSPLLNPMAEFNEVNFGLKYASPTLSISGGKLLVDGQIYVRGGQTFQLALALAGVDYYLWWDLSDETMKITAASAFPTMWDGTSNPLAWIMGGSTDQDRHLTGQLDKPTRGVPLYVFQQGSGGPATIDEATLCDLRRNVTKAALKNLLTVGARTDWATANFVPFASLPLLNETEAQFGCLDAAFRYINAMPHEWGNDEVGGGPASIKRWGRIVEVVGYTEERHWLQVPPDTEIAGSGYSVIGFHANATPNATAFPLAPLYPVMLLVGHGNSLRNVMVYAKGDISTRAAVGLVGPSSTSQVALIGKTVFEDVIVIGEGCCGVLGQTASAFSKPEVVFSRCLIMGWDEGAHGVAASGMYFETDMTGVTIVDTLIMGQDSGIRVPGWVYSSSIDRSVVWATTGFGGPGVLYPNGYGMFALHVDGLLIHDTQVISEHCHALKLGSGGADGGAILDGCFTFGSNLSGSLVASQLWVDVRATPAILRDSYIDGPDYDATETSNVLVGLVTNGSMDFSRTSCVLHGDAIAWSAGVRISGGRVSIAENHVFGPSFASLAGTTYGIRVLAASLVKIDGCVVDGFPGLGIDVPYAVPDVSIRGCSVDGQNYGNGIRGHGVIEGNEVKDCLSFGIHVYPQSTVVHNRIYGVNMNFERTDVGRVLFEEYGAWGIRYSPSGPGSDDVFSVQAKDNWIYGVYVNLETGPDGHDLCCGIGPVKETALSLTSRHMRNCHFDGNEIEQVLATAATINTEFHGIYLRNPVRQVTADHNSIEGIGGASGAAFSFGIGSLQSGGGATPTYVEDVSISDNSIGSVIGEYVSFGVYCGSGSMVKVNGNAVYGVYVNLATAVNCWAILYADQQSLGIQQSRLQFNRNQLGSGTSAVKPVGYALLGGIMIMQNDTPTINELEVIGNQCDRDLEPGVQYILILADGRNFTVKENEIRFPDGSEPSYGIVVSSMAGGLRNVVVDQNEAYGEFLSAFVDIDDVDVVHVAGNVQYGFDGAIAEGSGILLNLCEHIDVHDNVIDRCYPNPASVDALVKIRDCQFGSVHDNVLRGPTGGINIDSLRFEANAVLSCGDLHVHSNKIDPHGVALGPYDLGFYAIGLGTFGPNMTVWANVFGNPAVVGVDNLAALLGSYVPGPIPNNWNGIAFV